MPENENNPLSEEISNQSDTGKPPPKNIIICSDGTGNAGGQGYTTNVWAIYNAIDLNRENPKQIAFHDDGVGTESWKPLKIIGGAFGFGLSRNIRELYTVLAKNFNDGDRIYLFGFSRGAFTVRSLAGLIAKMGILDIGHDKIDGPKEIKKAVKRIYRQYRAIHRQQDYRVSPDANPVKRRLAKIFGPAVNISWDWWNGIRDWSGENYPCHNPDKGGKHIECVGVWDTVDAVGVPIDGVRDFLDFVFRNNFHEHGLNKDIAKGYHAIAIDDERKTFHPVMWDEDEETTGQVKQVWFAGVHSNVGGGYPKQGLANITLHWMMDEIQRDMVDTKGLHFTDGAFEAVAAKVNPHAMLYDSRHGAASLYRYAPRDIGKINAHSRPGQAPLIHDSVFERIKHHTHAYAPGHIPEEVEIFSTGGLPKNMEVKFSEPPVAAPDEALKVHYNAWSHLLDAASKWIKGRKVLYAFLLATLITLAVGVAKTYRQQDEAGSPFAHKWTKTCRCQDETGWPFVPEWAENALRSFYEAQQELLIGLLVLLIILFVLRTVFRSKARALFGKYWWKGTGSLPGD